MRHHLGELAELYALGSLDSGERATVEQHLRTCVECANRVRDAEETIGSIADLEAHHEPPEMPAESFAARLAASRTAQKLASAKTLAAILVTGLIALALSLAFFAQGTIAMRRVLAEDDRAISSIAAGHFRAAAFQWQDGGSMAQVLYSNDGSWYYVVVMDPKPTMAVAYESGGETFGRLRIRADCGTLYFAPGKKMPNLALTDRGATVAQANLRF